MFGMANEMITVRTERVGDQQGIQDVSAATMAILRQVYRPNQRALDNKGRLGECLQTLVAVSDDQVVGTVQYYLQDQSVRVIGLGVYPGYQRKGVARSLFLHLQEIGIREKASHLRLHTIKETGNVEVFRHLGFTVVAERETAFFESDTFEQLIEVEMEMALPETENHKKAAE
jgi:ribosomal protein S18 acetylase RimI-like enzyme